MQARKRASGELAVVCRVLGGLAFLMAPLFAQAGNDIRIPLPVDWSSRHVVHTMNFTPEQAARMRTDPRLWNSWLAQGHVQASHAAGAAHIPAKKKPDPSRPPSPPHRDWAVSLGPTAGVARNMYPAKFNFDVNGALTAANCASDFVVYGINAAGATGGQANLVALRDLYSGSSPTGLCGSAPTVKWAYNVTSLSAGRVTTSPVLAINGNMVAFVESNGSASVLHVLQWKAGEGAVAAAAAPANIITISNANVVSGSCPSASVSCDYRLTYNTSRGTTNSSPFYLYDGSDTLYVGDNYGQLYKITPVFTGAPRLSDTNGFSTACSGSAHGCIAVAAASTTMTGPVMDFNSRNIFIGGSDGKLYAVRSTAAGTHPSVTLGDGTANGGVADAPIVDGSTSRVFAYTGRNAANPGGVTFTADTAAIVLQTDTTTPFGSPVVANIGDNNRGNVHAGSFDNSYINWNGVGANTGHLYMCGFFTNDHPVLYGISFSGSAMVSGTPSFSSGEMETTTANECSPLSEIFTNGSQDLLFFGVGRAGGPSTANSQNVTSVGAVTSLAINSQGSGYSGTCSVSITGGGGSGATATCTISGGHVASVTLTNGGYNYSSTPTVTATGSGGGSNATFTRAVGAVTSAGRMSYTAPNALGGTSGIVVDNISNQTQASSIYFGTLATVASAPVVNIASATSPGSVGSNKATITTQTAHGFSSSDSVTVAGVTCGSFGCPNYNGNWAITVTDATHFTYTVCSFCLGGTSDANTGTATDNSKASNVFQAIKLTQSGLQ